MLACTILLSASSARADDQHRVTDLNSELATRPTRAITRLRRTGAVLAAIGPGLLVRGAGSYLVGEKHAARRLLQFGAIGLGAALVGGGPIGYSGGNPYTTPGLPVLLVGGGMFLTTWWADIATAAGVSRTGGRAVADPRWSIELATLWLHDPYREAGMVRVRAETQLGRFRLAAEDTRDYEAHELSDTAADLRVRIYGAPATNEVIADGSRLEVRGTWRYRKDEEFGLRTSTGELVVAGRLDLAHLDAALDGTFAELSAGIGEELVSYASSSDRDHDSLLLGGFAWGAYLGGHGELKLFYDNRRDGLVGGGHWLHTQGFIGSLGGSLDWMLDRHWGAHLQVEQGTAWLTTFGLRYRGSR